jgi:hypothetical protein
LEDIKNLINFGNVEKRVGRSRIIILISKEAPTVNIQDQLNAL